MKTAIAVDAAFRQLTAALEAEIAELKKVGGEVFHGGAPREAQGLLRSVHVEVRLRDHIKKLHAEWDEGVLSKSSDLPAPTPPLPSPKIELSPRTTMKKPLLIRNIKGMSIPRAADFLGVSTTKVRTWLQDGTLKGYRRVSGTWKIAQADLANFVREHRDLL